MRQGAYPLAVDTFDGRELLEVSRVLASGRLTMGAEVRDFEQEFASWVGAKRAVMTNSGSSANLIAVDAMMRRSFGPGLWKAGDEVLVPALAWPTTVWPLCQLGLVPVLVDVDPDTLAIDLRSAEQSLSPKTKGLFLIHPLGRCPEMGRYMAFCETFGLELLEDVCESLGAHHRGKHAGLFGKMGTFSTYFSHHVSTIEGGMVVTDDVALADDLRSLRSHGWSRDRDDAPMWHEMHPEIDPSFVFVMGGYNVRPDEIRAAIGRVQLGKLDQDLDEREEAAFHTAIRLPGWMDLVGEDVRISKDRRARNHSWMTLPFMVDESHDVASVKAHLNEHGVDTRPILAGNLCRHPAMKRFNHRRAGSLMECDRVMDHGFMVGCHMQNLEVLLEAIDSLRELS